MPFVGRVANCPIITPSSAFDRLLASFVGTHPDVHLDVRPINVCVPRNTTYLGTVQSGEMAPKANQATAICQDISRTSPANSSSASANGSLARDCDSDASNQAARNIDQTAAHLSSSILYLQELHISANTDGHNNTLTHSAMTDKKPVPSEVWLKVIECLDPKALKNARLVNKEWRDFVSTANSHKEEN